jgi:hypothetical protein
MTEHRSTSPRPSRLLLAGVWIAGVASVIGMIAMVLMAIEKVRTGHGLDTYRTFWMVENNWIGLLVFLGAAVVALAIGLLLRLKERHEIQLLQAKYSGDRHA